MENYEKYMKRCYELAISAGKKGHDTFGAVLVHDGEILEEAENTADYARRIFGHAEFNLVHKCANKYSDEILEKAVVYTSCAPCERCLSAIASLGVHQVVCGVSYKEFCKLLPFDYQTVDREGLLKQLGIQMTLTESVLEEEGMHVFEWWGGEYRPLEELIAEMDEVKRKQKEGNSKGGKRLHHILDQAKTLYGLEDCTFTPTAGHEGGRNDIFIVRRNGENQYVLRVSALGDRSEEEYLAETEFVRYLAQNGAPVTDVIPSIRGNLVERMEAEVKAVYVSLFAYAKGMLIVDNGYRYREGAPLSEYFFNIGKALGALHRLSKTYTPVHQRPDYFDKYNRAYLDRLIPDDFGALKKAVAKRLDAFRALPKDKSCYGLVHFDFSDGNYHIDMDTGAVTVFDFDNCMNCWYMFDLANLWIHNEGWTRNENDPGKRFELLQQCFDLQLQGYKTETDIAEEMLKQLPTFIDMVLIENIVDEFECCEREGEELDYEDIEDAARCLIESIPYAGFGQD